MSHQDKNNTSTRSWLTERDPIEQIHRRLAWALGTATGALIINAVVVIVMAESS